MFIWHWFLIVTGSNNVSGSWYGFWSGFAGDLTIFAAIIIWYKRNKCKSCWRLAYHKVRGTHYKTCHKHATIAHHAKIRSGHAEQYPEQHKFLKES